MAKISYLEKKQINAGLIQDIKDFVPIFNRPPTVAEVLVWAEDIYDLHHPAKSTITSLIKKANSTNSTNSTNSKGRG